MANQFKLVKFQRRQGLSYSKNIIFFSRLESINCLDWLIKGFAKLEPKYPETQLIILGDGSQRDRLERLARALGIEASLIFTGAIYDQNELAPWMMSACIFCYPRNIGLSILHAFGYELPVVASDDVSPHGPEIAALKGGDSGLFYQDGILEDMVYQCYRILSDENFQKRL